MRKPELLAPAGSRDALEAVIKAGADAVYVGGKKFAMRQHGAWLNFDDAALKSAIEFAHEHSAKVYVTVNNLLTPEEIHALEDHLAFLAAAGADAFILQDLGLLNVLNRCNFGVPLHASTMMNVHSVEGAQFLKTKGISRVITSRDITIYEAKDIAQGSGLEVEYFIHGDMCVAQSSQCLHSGMATEMSSNRGKCLKSCRWPWHLTDREREVTLSSLEEPYLLARKDICLYHQLPELIAAGIASLKIEGRARTGEYLFPIVKSYRQAMDCYVENPMLYRTDFQDLNFLRKHTLRDLHPNHAFIRPGPGSTGLTGEKEPRFFSVAVEEVPYAQDRAEKLKESCELSEAVSFRGSQPELSVRVATVETARAMLDTSCDWIYLGGEIFAGRERLYWAPDEILDFVALGHSLGKRIGIETPRVTTKRELMELEQLVRKLENNSPDEYLVHNVGSFHKIRSLTGVPIHADFSMNAWNREAAELFRREGIRMLTPGLELNLKQILRLAKDSPLPLEIFVHGLLPGMIMDYCVIGAHLTQTTKYDSCPGPCMNTKFALRNVLGDLYWLEADQYCRNHLFMSKDLCTIDMLEAFLHPNVKRFRIEGLLYELSYLKKLVAIYRDRIDNLPVPGREAFVQAIREGAPRPLTLGAYANDSDDISMPLKELPMNVVINHTH